MGRSRLSAETLALRGSFRKDPKRGALRAKEEAWVSSLDELGEPPQCFLDGSHNARQLRDIWCELTAIMPATSLKRPYRSFIETLCRVQLDCRGPNPKAGTVGVLLKMLKDCGLG